jgi:general secretion pathway protein D
MKSINTIILFILLISGLQARQQVDVKIDNISIKNYIQLISKINHINILVKQRIKGNINFVTNAPIYDDEMLDILISVLSSKGFTLIKSGSRYEVVRSSDAAKNNLKVITGTDKPKGYLMITQAIKIKQDNVDVVASKIRHLTSKNAKVVTMKESNTLLISDFPNNIRTIRLVIGELEEKNKNIVKIVPVEHAEIKQLHKELNNIVKSLFNVKISAEVVKVILNSEARSIVLVGRKRNVLKIQKLIKKLDKERSINQVVRIFPLKNSNSKQVLATLNAIVSKQVFIDPSLKPSLSGNEEINSIIILGKQSIIDGIASIIKEIDKEKYQVYVQARIVEISASDVDKLGIKYGLEGGIVNSSGLYTFAGNFGGAATAGSILANKLSGKLGDVKKGIIIGSALDFLSSKGASKTISSPSILCVNNKESSIYVGETIPFESTIASTVATTKSFKREDVGLTLSIKPRVSSKDKVTLDVKIELENVVRIDTISNQPTTSKQKVETQAILRHGESIIIGGLVKKNDRMEKTKVPLLGDIPYLGALFRHEERTEGNNNLLVLLTPYVISKSENLSILQQELGELGRLQGKYNKKVFELIERRAEEKEAQEIRAVEKEDLSNVLIQQDEDEF